jgi:phage N-6-adenine-methyltransferase
MPRPRVYPSNADRQRAYRRRVAKNAASLPLKTRQTLFSSRTAEWATPRKLFASLDAEFGFSLDVAADDINHCCPRYFTAVEDGLKQDWGAETCWCNPPYGRRINEWLAKAYEAAQHGATVVCLIPARTCTSWWHDYCLKGEIRYIRGRLTFNDDKKKRAPFPSAVVIFRPSSRRD